MPHPLLCPIILSCIFFAFPTITALVPLGVFQPLQRQIRFRKERGVGVLVVAYSTKESDPVVDKLFQRDPDIDAPLPPAFIDCPFTGILGGPDAFYRTASRALQSPSLFSFLYQDRPMVEVTGGSNARRLLRQENFSNLTSNAVPGVSQMVCGTSSLRTVTDKVEHRVLRELIGVPLSSPPCRGGIRPALGSHLSTAYRNDCILR